MKTKKSVSYEEGLMERLKDPQYAAGYLETSMNDKEDNPEELFLIALRDVAKAYGFTHIAKKSHLGRESLYKALSKKGDPRLSTLTSVLDAIGLKFSIQLKQAS